MKQTQTVQNLNPHELQKKNGQACLHRRIYHGLKGGEAIAKLLEFPQLPQEIAIFPIFAWFLVVKGNARSTSPPINAKACLTLYHDVSTPLQSLAGKCRGGNQVVENRLPNRVVENRLTRQIPDTIAGNHLAVSPGTLQTDFSFSTLSLLIN